jgi:hypothetical protein
VRTLDVAPTILELLELALIRQSFA